MFILSTARENAAPGSGINILLGAAVKILIYEAGFFTFFLLSHPTFSFSYVADSRSSKTPIHLSRPFGQISISITDMANSRPILHILILRELIQYVIPTSYHTALTLLGAQVAPAEYGIYQPATGATSA
jgi:hypothetical protein